MEAGGQVLVDERDTVTTVLISGSKFLGTQRELARKFVEAHRALTTWITEHPDEAKALVVKELAEETRAKISDELIANAWKRIVLTNEVKREALDKFVGNAKAAGFLRDVPDLSRLIDIP
jgi:NitT/TauT family transport system substrate-binding protein